MASKWWGHFLNGSNPLLQFLGACPTMHGGDSMHFIRKIQSSEIKFGRKYIISGAQYCILGETTRPFLPPWIGVFLWQEGHTKQPRCLEEAKNAPSSASAESAVKRKHCNLCHSRSARREWWVQEAYTPGPGRCLHDGKQKLQSGRNKAITWRWALLLSRPASSTQEKTTSQHGHHSGMTIRVWSALIMVHGSQNNSGLILPPRIACPVGCCNPDPAEKERIWETEELDTDLRSKQTKKQSFKTRARDSTRAGSGIPVELKNGPAIMMDIRRRDTEKYCSKILPIIFRKAGHRWRTLKKEMLSSTSVSTDTLTGT